MINWFKEEQLIIKESIKHGIDPLFVATIRRIENGGPGREYGVLSIPAPTYKEQLHITCNSVRNKIMKSALFPIALKYDRLCYTRQFIEYFQHHWAPSNVANDPNNLNKNWLLNTCSVYDRFCQLGRIGEENEKTVVV